MQCPFELPLTPHKWNTAGTARYLTIICLWPSFDFDQLIEGIAVRASVRIERLVTSMIRPQYPILFVNCQGTRTQAVVQLLPDRHRRRSCCVGWKPSELGSLRT